METTSRRDHVNLHLQQALDRVQEWGVDAGLEYSLDKSNILSFRNVSGPYTRFTLGDNQLTQVPSYNYLGITMSQNLRDCSEQSNSLSSKLAISANLISRTNCFFSAPPGPACCLALVRSILLPKLQYILPFTRFSKVQLDSFSHIIARPLKTCLGLPRKTSSAAVLCDFGIADIMTLRDKELLLQYCRSMKDRHEYDSLPTLLYQDTFQALCSSITPSGPKFAVSIAEEIREIMEEWDLEDCNSSRDVLKQQQVTMDKRWKQAKSGIRLRKNKTSVFTSFYILHDSKPTVCLRARLRHDVANNSSSKFRRKLADSPRCLRCGMNDDDREHLLMHCSSFRSARQAASTALMCLEPSVVMTSNLIMGHIEDDISKPSKKVKRHWASILDITGKFLLDINKTMHRL